MKSLLSLSLIMCLSQEASAGGVKVIGKLAEETAITFKRATTHSVPKVNVVKNYAYEDILKKSAEEVRVIKSQNGVSGFSWPKNNKTVSTNELLNNSISNLDKEAILIRNDTRLGDVDWTGVKKIKGYNGGIDLEENFSGYLLGSPEYSGESANKIIISAILNIGSLQGRSYIKESKEAQTLKLSLIKVNSLLKNANNSQEFKYELIAALESIKSQADVFFSSVSKPINEQAVQLMIKRNKNLTSAFVDFTEGYYTVTPLNNTPSREYLEKFINSNYSMGFEKGRRSWIEQNMNDSTRLMLTSSIIYKIEVLKMNKYDHFNNLDDLRSSMRDTLFVFEELN